MIKIYDFSLMILNDTGKSTGNIPMALIIVSDPSCLRGSEAAPMITKLHTRAGGELANHLPGWVPYLISGEHAAIKSKQTLSVFSFRLVEKKWRLALLFMYSRLVFKDRNDFSQQNLVKIPGLILHGYDSSCCVTLVMLQCRARRASPWQRGIRALASLQD